MNNMAQAITFKETNYELILTHCSSMDIEGNVYADISYYTIECYDSDNKCSFIAESDYINFESEMRVVLDCIRFLTFKHPYLFRKGILYNIEVGAEDHYYKYLINYDGQQFLNREFYPTFKYQQITLN